jgi:hypothetical protein
MVGILATQASATDYLIPERLFVAKPDGKLVKFISKPAVAHTQPASSPNVTGATLHVFDTGLGGGDDTYFLNPGQWRELGASPGSSGVEGIQVQRSRDSQ